MYSKIYIWNNKNNNYFIYKFLEIENKMKIKLHFLQLLTPYDF